MASAWTSEASYLGLLVLADTLAYHKQSDVVLGAFLKDVVCHSNNLPGAYNKACLLECFSLCTLQRCFAKLKMASRKLPVP